MILSKKILFFIKKFFIFLVLALFPLLTPLASSLGMTYLLYITFFMITCSHWYYLGKEIDHRFQFNYRSNSSIDKVYYRVFLGQIISFIFYSFFIYLPQKYFWIGYVCAWLSLAIIVAWPSRKKIINESFNMQLSEFKFLDSFERLTLFLCIALCILSFPTKYLALINSQAFVLPYKQNTILNTILNFYHTPFNYPAVQTIKIFFFYCYGILTTVVGLYCLLRYFFARRLSLLGVFFFLTSWSIYKINHDYFWIANIFTAFSILWLWTNLWNIKSKTYRTGFFFGLVGFIGVFLQTKFLFIYLIFLALQVHLMKEETKWYRLQFFKYNTLGIVLIILNLIFFKSMPINNSSMYGIFDFIAQKKILSLALIGLFFHIFLFAKEIKNYRKVQKIYYILFMILFMLINFIFELSFASFYFLISFIIFYSLVPIDILFQNMNSYRSKRNLIFAIYIIIALLDSRIEGRIKMMYKLFSITD